MNWFSGKFRHWGPAFLNVFKGLRAVLLRTASGLNRSPEVFGVLCGLCALSLNGWIHHGLQRPAAALLALIGITMVCGAVAGAAPGALGIRPDLAARRGARAAGWAGFAAVVCFLLMARHTGGVEASRKAALISAGSLLPALFAGSIAATLGMLLLRGREAVLEPAKLPKSAIWGLRCLLAAGVLTSLLTLVSPDRLPDTGARSMPFSYTAPEELKTAPPAAWDITARRFLGRVNPDIIAVSPDHTLLAVMDGDTNIVVRHLNRDSARYLPSLPHPARRLSFSPDAKRIFVVMNSDPLRLAVVVVDTGEIIALPQPKRHAVPEGPALWAEEDRVLFSASGGKSQVYSLKSLELEEATAEEERKLRLTRHDLSPSPPNPLRDFKSTGLPVSAELPETMGTADWPLPEVRVLSLRDRKYAQARFFPGINASPGDRLLATDDGSRILRFSSGGLEVFYFGLRSVPPLRWGIQLPHGPEKMPPQTGVSEAGVREALELGRLKLHLYPPLINPLTKQTIGPDRSRLKSVLGISRWIGRDAEVWMEILNESWVAGDVLADVFIADGPSRILLFDQPHRWWTIAPEPAADAADTARLPTREEMLNRVRPAPAPARPVTPLDPETASNSSGQSVPEVSGEPGIAAPPEPHTPADAPSPADGRESTVEEEIRNFVLSHHARLSEGRVDEAVRDYADKVHYFENEDAGRESILEMQRTYHRQYESVRETVAAPDIRVGRIGPKIFQADYPMRSEQRRDGKTTVKVVNVRLSVRRGGSGGWLIIKQTSPKN